ncbi:MAG: transporter, Spinster family, sphingosine-phosphate transporter [Verrucomicrobiota bacterium]|jgi:MFS family permease
MAMERKAGARTALTLLMSINLFNYIDRQVLSAVEPEIRATFFRPDDPNAMAMTGTLATAFLVTYMLAAPALGWLADRFSRWLIIGCAVVLWSLASGASGLAMTFIMLLLTRIFVGIGEGGYGPAAPTILADLFPLTIRGRVMAAFCAAIPVGSALGYVLGGTINVHLGWRWAFYLVTPPGLLLGLFCFFQRDPRTRKGERSLQKRANLEDYVRLAKTRSFVFNTFAQTTMTFALGGIAFWMPAYLQFRQQPASSRILLGAITVVAGLISTIVGGVLGDRLRIRVPGSYFLVSGIGMLIAFPLFLGMLYAPFPAAWVLFSGAVFFVFLNTGPSNTALANVSLPSVRATAFAMNILMVHALGDAISPPVIGVIAGHSNMNAGFVLVSAMMLISGLLWLAGMKSLPADTEAVELASVRDPVL